MQQEEHVSNGPKKGDQDSEMIVVAQTDAVRTDIGEEEKERIDEESNNGGYEEDIVPIVDNVAVRIEDLVAP